MCVSFDAVIVSGTSDVKWRVVMCGFLSYLVYWLFSARSALLYAGAAAVTSRWQRCKRHSAACHEEAHDQTTGSEVQLERTWGEERLLQNESLATSVWYVYLITITYSAYFKHCAKRGHKMVPKYELIFFGSICSSMRCACWGRVRVTSVSTHDMVICDTWVCCPRNSETIYTSVSGWHDFNGPLPHLMGDDECGIGSWRQEGSCLA